MSNYFLFLVYDYPRYKNRFLELPCHTCHIEQEGSSIPRFESNLRAQIEFGA